MALLNRMARGVLAPLLATVCLAARHPGQHLDLRIHIDETAVRYTVTLSTDLGNLIFLNEPAAFRPLRELEKYEFVDAEQERKTRTAFEAFFGAKNPVTIDGVRVTPIIESFDWVPNPALAGTQDPYSFPPDARFVLVYTTKGCPQSVSMVWELYPQDATLAALGEDAMLPVVAELDAFDENRIITFTADEPEVTWHAASSPPAQRVTPVLAEWRPAVWHVPAATAGLLLLAFIVGLIAWGKRERGRGRVLTAVAALAFVGAAYARNLAVVDIPVPWSATVEVPNAAAARALFTALHRNVYRAFDYKTESDIYDVLARSVAGDLLERVYREVYQSLILRDQGGAVARVQSVEVRNADIVASGVEAHTDAPAFTVQCTWLVNGAVYHWGHVHTRTNEYTARYIVAQRGDRWKIVGVEVRAQRRIVKEGDDPLVTPRPGSGGDF